MSILKNYTLTIFLLTGILVGGICGVIFGEATKIVKPIGELFLNLMFVLIVPLVFFSISSAICNMQKSNMVGKIIRNIVLVFIVMAVIASLLGYIIMLIYNPLSNIDPAMVISNLPKQQIVNDLFSADIIVRTFTVPDFLELFTKSNLLPLIIFSILFGLAVSLSGEKGKKVSGMLDACSQVIMKMIGIIMYAAPIGLGCYFADTVGTIGGQVIDGYIHVFIMYLILAVISFFGLNSLYMFFAGGKKAFIAFWKNMLTPSLTAIATSSSAACIPINIEAAQRIGVPSNIAETVIPLGTNMLKSGSVIGGVIKIVFLFTLFGQDTVSVGNIFAIVGVSLLVGVVMGAIPSGGMTGELLICSVFGFSPELAGTLMIISTIIDVPATLLNSTGNVTASVLTTRLTIGKNWITKPTQK